ncbi:MAG: ABC transporter permease [Candidatus Competibacterales bacterium]|nr:ABC transporter permease [Candidatus Competibacterales bacterium]
MAVAAIRAGGRTGDFLERIRNFSLIIVAFALGIWAQAGGLVDDIIYYWPDIVYLTRQHIWLTLISGGLAILVGVPLGALMSRPFMRKVAESMMQVLNIGTTIPTLAVLALSMSWLGIGTTPAIFGLWIVSLLPIVRNTYAGIAGVAPHLKEAAHGMGMSPLQILWRVELPNALYVIFAGIRTALAINIGTVPLAFLIGAGGLGELIFTGIDLADTGMMLSGAIPTALLAVVVDFILSVLTFLLVPKGVNPLRN